MPLCRVLSKPDGSVVVIHPAPKARRSDETYEWFYARAVAKTLKANPAWRDLPGIDVDVDSLPDRASRATWCVRDGAVVAKPRGS